MEWHKGMHKLPRLLDVPKFPVGVRFGSAGELRVVEAGQGRPERFIQLGACG